MGGVAGVGGETGHGAHKGSRGGPGLGDMRDSLRDRPTWKGRLRREKKEPGGEAQSECSGRRRAERSD